MLELVCLIVVGLAVWPVLVIAAAFFWLGLVCLCRIVTHPVTLSCAFILLVMWLIAGG